MWIVNLKPYVEVVQAVVITGAIIIGGIWTYMLFVKNRSKYPKLRLKHTVYSRDIDTGFRLLRVTLTIENQSNILVKTGKVTLRLLQVEPWPVEILNHKILRHDQASYTWPYIDYRSIMANIVEIEPGERGEYYFDFVTERDRRAVIVYSWVQNLQKQEIGWTLKTAFDLDTQGDKKQELVHPTPILVKPKEKEMNVKEQIMEVVNEEQTEIDNLSPKARLLQKSAEPGRRKQEPEEPLPPPAPPATPPEPPPTTPPGPSPGGPSGPSPGGPPGPPPGGPSGPSPGGPPGPPPGGPSGLFQPGI